ncbi:MAG: Rossman fold protein, TIGR00730 family [Candidatus Kerfeldbacteria bacterium RIFCSPHIGHO2_02_FULL_42_14]|uniref:Cytokinin riboside 5'-monophosphate phosphoribohydrolase n=1 Tax=Candidatus Kerfeldbacteria bacterium RIFCSPHIGHO2_02_FULL_42_14 TaxID=1798540 RepID=A0A1G2AQ88_9BACT|nr:MAG: Rossman fold protein, TIGR00730 family [Candidatus Kerfeldbacteria bacterium RIFCSPHIGHO2_02_FULL_42_14]OGY80703.1 MAG: Rossman fold protein, TIGR00730 family [Candidatus Kerfeldbacteria bacterium RIFCSPHIGHO2_12_FULL_42_13]OGY82630.1 MAG: Rossman fold protein, TIGR00730 family [Candidatus Kerfeldbacteria bacterium RIFCSPLOWO2_02_FULL_42_19]OGY85233.1 MAG: Rossman fold protein, TIGR00730 family [Candidatus Kerfeldbacteria bacterium RIFCSPLOWO2_12_FULL_43_9]
MYPSTGGKILFSSLRSNVTWMVFRIMSEFVSGFEFLSKLKHEVSFFGSARFPEHNVHYQEARQLARMLNRAGYTIITGGGAGIMEAGNRGAVEGHGKGESVGINIQLPKEQRTNPYVRKSMAFSFFFTRKVMLSASSQAYVFFPGGFGTLDEFFEMLNLIQTRKIEPVKLILIGKDFWQPLLDWITKVMYTQHKAISKQDMRIYSVASDIHDAFRIIRSSHERAYVNREH